MLSMQSGRSDGALGLHPSKVQICRFLGVLFVALNVVWVYNCRTAYQWRSFVRGYEFGSVIYICLFGG